ncbi:hypothetical protein F4553_007851 [Allocatelliglobosispora scoriae]|uniref:Uncharacterized protein n=1 Tax=Allocatelliglobosispora scoriae TaxID=643052 RepID=A0A841BZ49_9ACTN|nr:hypothetical protein [Allocatelliglobosispora scoriae]MBB5874417.1 hypothetical protein [Allocatelliglobosispora scoriae]
MPLTTLAAEQVEHIPSHVKTTYPTCNEARSRRLTPPPSIRPAAEHVDHIPAHVKNSYVNCTDLSRGSRLSPAPTVTR